MAAWSCSSTPHRLTAAHISDGNGWNTPHLAAMSLLTLQRERRRGRPQSLHTRAVPLHTNPRQPATAAVTGDTHMPAQSADTPDPVGNHTIREKFSTPCRFSEFFSLVSSSQAFQDGTNGVTEPQTWGSPFRHTTNQGIEEAEPETLAMDSSLSQPSDRGKQPPPTPNQSSDKAPLYKKNYVSLPHNPTLRKTLRNHWQLSLLVTSLHLSTH